MRSGEATSVLLVEDDPDLRRMYSRRLQVDGHHVLTAADGPQALAAASAGPSLILLDIRMPGMSGLEVLRRLKQGVDTADLPVVMLTNESDADLMAACLALGALDWWSKFETSPGTLSRRVGELIRSARSSPAELSCAS